MDNNNTQYMSSNYAPIDVKPEEGGGGGRATHGNLTVTYIPRVGFSISNSRREVKHLFLLILTIIFYQGVGILIFFIRKCQNPHPMPAHPPPPQLGLYIDRCIRAV